MFRNDQPRPKAMPVRTSPTPPAGRDDQGGADSTTEELGAWSKQLSLPEVNLSDSGSD